MINKIANFKIKTGSDPCTCSTQPHLPHPNPDPDQPLSAPSKAPETNNVLSVSIDLPILDKWNNTIWDSQ